ncbi:uncharacterized protein V1513DRAFT_139385 [Lipomyces chichibuensis]|uniref:uncharacterized protein n=1 Tax=Lipomyces chichibuensis TaxID=1546026 RepID=UPI0033434E69
MTELGMDFALYPQRPHPNQTLNLQSSPSASNHHTEPEFTSLDNFTSSAMSYLSSKPQTVMQDHDLVSNDIFSQGDIHINLGISPNSDPGLDTSVPTSSSDWILNNKGNGWDEEVQESMYKRLSTGSFFDAVNLDAKKLGHIDTHPPNAYVSDDPDGRGPGAARDLPTPWSLSVVPSGTNESKDEPGRPSQIRKRGRPRLIAKHEKTDRRRAQIRDAQRTYRQKKDRTIMDLQSRINLLESTVEGMQSVFLDVYEHGVQVAMQHHNAKFVQTLAGGASKVLDMTRSAILDPGSVRMGRIESRADSSDSSTPPPSGIAQNRRVTPAILMMRDALSVSVAERQGKTFSQKLIEAIYRTCFTVAKFTIESRDKEAIRRIFPQGDSSAVTMAGLNTILLSSEPIYMQTWHKRVDDDSQFPGYMSPASIAASVTQFVDNQRGAQRYTIDGDALVAWLYCRGQCMGKMPRFKAIDVDIGLLIAQRAVSV